MAARYKITKLLLDRVSNNKIIKLKETFQMLKSKLRTKEETKAYLKELKQWLEQAKNDPTEEMADFFKKRIDVYEDVHLGHWAEEYSHIADYFDDGLTTLLDIGCGTGLELEAVFYRFPDVKVTGIDLSETMLQKLQEHYEGKAIQTIQADYFKYPLEQEAFDAALSFETLHHFKYDKKQKIYDKLYHALKDGGYYVECDYYACCDEEENLCLEGYEYRRKTNNIPEDVFVHIDIPLTLEHQLELMKKAGFQKIDVLYEKEGTFILKAMK